MNNKERGERVRVYEILSLTERVDDRPDIGRQRFRGAAVEEVPQLPPGRFQAVLVAHAARRVQYQRAEFP